MLIFDWTGRCHLSINLPPLAVFSLSSGDPPRLRSHPDIGEDNVCRGLQPELFQKPPQSLSRFPLTVTVIDFVRFAPYAAIAVGRLCRSGS